MVIKKKNYCFAGLLGRFTFIYLVNKCLPSAYYVPDTILGNMMSPKPSILGLCSKGLCEKDERLGGKETSR